jgi:hypothetical protein
MSAQRQYNSMYMYHCGLEMIFFFFFLKIAYFNKNVDIKLNAHDGFLE